MAADTKDDLNDDSSSVTSEEPSEVCEDDRCSNPQLPILHCVDCDSSYCSDCWGRQGPHKPNKKGRDGIAHEKTNPRIVKRLKSILTPTRNPEEIQRMHEDDESTKWFGVSRDLTGRPSFEDYGRYASLMSSISPIESLEHRYPQVVSFIGVTNAGKSTLIKMLVNHEADINSNTPENSGMFPSPIVGSVVNDTLPTSGDVHLYADSATHAEQLPILYADCEGFEGGERTPLGARSRRRARSSPTAKDTPEGYVHTRPIEWANTEEQRQREYTVTALYPRILYTFSDSVVFLLRNPKTFQSAVLTKLLDWGVAALEKSLNQPALPHCIVAINGTDPSVDDREWDTNFATQSLLSSVKGALDYVEGVPRFRELAEHWRSLGKHIYTVEDLILRYYSSFKVIRIPSKPRYMLIHQQIGKLHEIIKGNCEESFRAKRRARMLTNADELNVYLQSGFDHFTTHLNVPFNFMQISLLRNPIPNDFGGHILQLCSTISSHQPNHQPGRIAWIFEKLSVMLASCVLLDCARFRKGRVDELFSNYSKFFDWALSEYLELHHPCSYVSGDGTRQCMLVKARHLPKGHQDEQGIIASGDYLSSFGPSFLAQWKAQLRNAIEGIHRDFSYELEQASSDDNQNVPEEKIALDFHLEYLNNFFEAVGPASSICSHATCFCCLMDVPEHPLPCGHVLCTACVKAYGKQTKSLVSLTCCPLHTESTKWARPTIVKFKPTGAGIRILALDGGGIRGIVQLEQLRAIEQLMGSHIPISTFFDLIVGTGTGGLIGVALSMRDRSVDSCIDMFKAICEHAYTPRIKGVPVISRLVQLFGSGPKYKTKPMYEALKTALSEDDDLFGVNTRLRTGARVGITATSVTGRESILLANYRRPEDLLPAYSFERPHEPDMELKVWESVAAGLANPSSFKPFNFHNKTYLDGGLRCPNPAFIADRERRLIWPDVGEPDLFLSLGTGQNRITVLSKLAERPNQNESVMIPQPGQTATESRKKNSRWRPRRLDDIVDIEAAWITFRDHSIKERSEGRRLIRFNSDLDREPPASDSKGDLESLQVNVRKRLQTPGKLGALKNVANRLIASSFYLDLQSKATGENRPQVCQGVLSCRFEDGSSDMRGMGKILQSAHQEGFEPFFYVRPDSSEGNFAFKVPITKDVTETMIKHAVFGLPNLFIPLKDESKPTAITLFLSRHDGLEPEGFPVSGFPRVLLGEQVSASHRPDQNQKKQISEQAARNQGHSRNASRTVEAESISLNGHPERSSRSNSSEESWQETQARVLRGSGVAKRSLAELIAESQGNGNSSRPKTNRFWTYIGNNHMAQHPERYSADELAKYAAVHSAHIPAELASPTELPSPTPTEHHLPPYSASSMSVAMSQSSSPPPSESHELDADDKITREIRSQRSIAAIQQKLPIHPSMRPRSPQKPMTPPQRFQQQSPSPRQSPLPSPVRKPLPSPPPQQPTLKIQPARQQHIYQQAVNPRSPPIYRQPSARESVASPAETEFEEYSDTMSDVHVGEAQASPILQIGPPFPIRKKGQGFEQSPLESAIQSALPDVNSITSLDSWLSSPTSNPEMNRGKQPLRVVNEEIGEYF